MVFSLMSWHNAVEIVISFDLQHSAMKTRLPYSKINCPLVVSGPQSHHIDFLNAGLCFGETVFSS